MGLLGGEKCYNMFTYFDTITNITAGQTTDRIVVTYAVLVGSISCCVKLLQYVVMW